MSEHDEAERVPSKAAESIKPVRPPLAHPVRPPARMHNSAAVRPSAGQRFRRPSASHRRRRATCIRCPVPLRRPNRLPERADRSNRPQWFDPSPGTPASVVGSGPGASFSGSTVRSVSILAGSRIESAFSTVAASRERGFPCPAGASRWARLARSVGHPRCSNAPCYSCSPPHPRAAPASRDYARCSRRRPAPALPPETPRPSIGIPSGERPQVRIYPPPERSRPTQQPPTHIIAPGANQAQQPPASPSSSAVPGAPIPPRACRSAASQPAPASLQAPRSRRARRLSPGSVLNWPDSPPRGLSCRRVQDRAQAY